MAQTANQKQRIQEFIDELSGFAQIAETTLELIESDMVGNRGQFSVFQQKMFDIRGTAQQLNLPEIARIAGLGEEIAAKASSADTRPKIRKCVGALWDALTTVKHLLIHEGEETSEERDILILRLQATLNALGGARPKMDEDEIAKLLAERKS